MATIADVRAWTVKRGKGHVVDMAQHGWVHTLCQTYGPGRWRKTKPRQKICAVCLKNLALATVKA